MTRFPVYLVCAALFVAPVSPVAAQTVLLSEDFDAVNTLTGQGWAFRNTSTEPTDFWGGGNEFIFPAQAGLPDSYAASGFGATAGNAPDEIISNWLLTPVLSFTNNVSVSFWTRTISPVFAPDRFELRLSTSGESTNVGDSPASTGDFGTLLLEINPTQSEVGYPDAWTQFEIVLAGVQGVQTGRIGLRHYVENAGLSGVNGDFIGVDTLRIQVPPPVTVPEAGSALLFVSAVALGIVAKRNRHY